MKMKNQQYEQLAGAGFPARRTTTNRSEALAERLEAGAAALAAFAAPLSEEHWQTRLPKDRRKVGVVVHHVASMYPLEIQLAKLLAAGRPITDVTWCAVDEVEATNYFDMGPQNSRGFRALKVWLALQHAGAAGYREMIQDDITLAQYLHDLARDHPELEAITNCLSITTLRYVPRELRASLGSEPTEDYLNRLNQRLLAAMEKSGEAFISNAVIDGKYALRFCIVNFRASTGDIEAMPQLVVRLGRRVHAELTSVAVSLGNTAPGDRPGSL